MSSFAGRGKKRAFEMVRDNQVINDSVGTLGESLPLSILSAQSITRLEKVVCMLYNDSLCKLVNDLRYKTTGLRLWLKQTFACSKIPIHPFLAVVKY